MGKLKVRRLAYALGAEVTGVDLSAALEDETIAEIRRTWLEHVVLCFPGQDIEPKPFADFCARFGPLDEAKPELCLTGTTTVQEVKNNPAAEGGAHQAWQRPDKLGGTFWHSDRSYQVRPAVGTFILAKQMPDVGGNTMVNNMYLAYETLSPTMQGILEPLWGVHDKSRSYVDLEKRTGHDLVMATRHQAVMHPVVRVHPETGRKALYFGAGSRTRKFVGMTEEESKPILSYLSEHIQRYEFVYRHAWKVGDVLMWDNRCAMHQVVADFDPRQLRRLIRCASTGPQTGEYYDEATDAAAVPTLREPAVASSP